VPACFCDASDHWNVIATEIGTPICARRNYGIGGNSLGKNTFQYAVNDCEARGAGILTTQNNDQFSIDSNVLKMLGVFWIGYSKDTPGPTFFNQKTQSQSTLPSTWFSAVITDATVGCVSRLPTGFFGVGDCTELKNWFCLTPCSLTPFPVSSSSSQVQVTERSKSEKSERSDNFERSRGGNGNSNTNTNLNYNNEPVHFSERNNEIKNNEFKTREYKQPVEYKQPAEYKYESKNYNNEPVYNSEKRYTEKSSYEKRRPSRPSYTNEGYNKEDNYYNQDN